MGDAASQIAFQLLRRMQQIWDCEVNCYAPGRTIRISDLLCGRRRAAAAALPAIRLTPANDACEVGLNLNLASSTQPGTVHSMAYLGLCKRVLTADAQQATHSIAPRLLLVTDAVPRSR
jgi:hypothetical protein